MSKIVYIVDGARTPFLKARGGPGAFSASDLSVAAGKPLLMRQPFSADQFDEVILGCVNPSVDEVNIARVASLRLGCGKGVPAWTVQRNCASGMQAVDAAANNIRLGRSELVLAGGTEAMSRAPILFNQAMATWLGQLNASRNLSDKLSVMAQFRPMMLKPIIGLLRGLTDPVVGLTMGQTAELIADRFSITRQEMDAFAVSSHERLGNAIDNGFFEKELSHLFAADGTPITADEGLRRGSSVEKLAKLRPVFERPYGKVTAGNSAQITDGAAWLILASAKAVKQHKLKPIGKLLDANWAGCDPAQMGLGPVHAVTPMLQRNKLSLSDIQAWEINEAFAGQVLACLAAWKNPEYCQSELGLKKAMGEIDTALLNQNGGGISIGHPVGATGARIVLHLLHTLRHRQQKMGVASLCIGGGQGGAMLVEAVRA